MRKRWILSDACLVSAEDYFRPNPKRSHLTTPMVISDQLDYVQSMLDGKRYTSKSGLRRSYRDADGDIREVGNDALLTKGQIALPDERAIKDVVGKSLARVGITD